MGQTQVKYGERIQRGYGSQRFDYRYIPTHKGDIVRYRSEYYIVIGRVGYVEIAVMRISDDVGKYIICPKEQPNDSNIVKIKRIDSSDPELIPLFSCSEKLKDWMAYREWFKRIKDEMHTRYQLQKKKVE